MSKASRSLGRRVLRSKRLRTSATLYHQGEGGRNQYGEFVPGAITATAIKLVTAPTTGQEREVLPEGLRERDVRRFWTLDAATAIVAGEDDGDWIRSGETVYRIVESRDWGGFRELMGVKPEIEPALPPL